MENKSNDGYRPIIQISLNAEGKKKVDTAPVAKEVIVGLLADCLKLIAMKDNNVATVPKGVTPSRIRDWVNRKKKK